jgi:hypothetical protein
MLRLSSHMNNVKKIMMKMDFYLYIGTICIQKVSEGRGGGTDIS